MHIRNLATDQKMKREYSQTQKATLLYYSFSNKLIF